MQPHNINNSNSSNYYNRRQDMQNMNEGLLPEASALRHLVASLPSRNQGAVSAAGSSPQNISGVSPNHGLRISPHYASGTSPHSASGISPHSVSDISPHHVPATTSPHRASGISPHYASGMISPHSASGISPHQASGVTSPHNTMSAHHAHGLAAHAPGISTHGELSHHGAAGLHNFTGAPGLHHFTGYSYAGPSSHHAVSGHSVHYSGVTGHHGTPVPSGYHGHASAAASHMIQTHQGHTTHPVHPWYQSYHQPQMQNVGNPYCMQDDQYNVWQHRSSMFPNEYVDLLGHNFLQMNSAMSQHQHFDQRLDDMNRLPSPTATLSQSDHSSPGIENMTPPTPPNIPNVSNHPSQFQGAHAISTGAGGPYRNGGRPNVARSPFEWIRKSSYQSQPNPGKTRTKDKYRIVYTDNQRIQLEKEFTFCSRYITIRRKTELAESLGLSERQIKIWFQNRRAKERKQQKKEEEEKLAQTNRLARNFANFPGLIEVLEDPQLVNNPLPSGSRQQIQTPAVNVTTSGGLLTPPSGSQDVLPPSCSYQNHSHLQRHMRDDPDDHGTAG